MKNDYAIYNSNEFGKRLKQIRKKNKYTQERLAEELHLSPDSISNYESGKTCCMPEHMMKICQLFNVSADYFFFGIERQLDDHESDNLATINSLVEKCSDFDRGRIVQMIQIILAKPVA